MKHFITLVLGVAVSYAVFSQSSFQSTLLTGISLPAKSNAVNSTHAGEGIHFGNHLDYSFGAARIRFGLGAYIGYLNTFNANVDYKKIGQSIADKYRLPQSQIDFKESYFKSAHLLLGPVASFQSKNWDINLWAKGGYGLNEPGKYSVIYKEGNLVNNIYSNQAGDNKNGVAYNVGGGIQYFISSEVGLQFGANYFGTQTGQVNYNYDREKGTSPLYFTAKNNFIQGSIGLNLKFAKEKKSLQNTRLASSKSNVRNNRVAQANDADSDNDGYENPQGKITKSRSNIQNNRSISAIAAEDEDDDNDGIYVDDMHEDDSNDSLIFVPEKIEIRTESQSIKTDFAAGGLGQMRSVNNYLTGFVYQTENGAAINQCGSAAMEGEPITGIDVKFKRLASFGNDVSTISTKTNRDGSFSFNNIEPGNYTASVGDDKMNIAVKSNNESDYQVLETNSGACSNAKENYIILLDNKMFVEVISAREAASGMATGKKHVGNVKYEDFSTTAGTDQKIIVSTQQHAINTKGTGGVKGKIIPSIQNHAINTKGTGANNGRMAGNISGNDLGIISPRDSSGLSTGKRMHKPFKVVGSEFDINTENIIKDDGKLYAEVITAREAGTGMATGRILITGDVDGDGLSDYEIVSPRDAASGMPTGKRMHKPMIIMKELDADYYENVSPRDAASGMATGKRMHKPMIIVKELDADNYEIVSPRDAASGMPTGKRMHKPMIIVKELDADNYEIVSPRDAASGMPTGKRMHKPMIIMKELDADNYEIVSPRDAASGMPAGRRSNIKSDEDYQPWNEDDADEIASNPIYQNNEGSGENPLLQTRNAIRINGSNGAKHDIFIPDNLTIKQGIHPEVKPFEEYNVMPIKWMAPESISNQKGWDGTVKGNSNKNYVRKGIQENGIKKNKVEVRGWDMDKKNKNDQGQNKNGLTTSSNIKDIRRINCANGTCAIECVVEIEGINYDAVVKGSFETLQDSRKSIMSIVR